MNLRSPLKLTRWQLPIITLLNRFTQGAFALAAKGFSRRIVELDAAMNEQPGPTER